MAKKATRKAVKRTLPLNVKWDRNKMLTLPAPLGVLAAEMLGTFVLALVIVNFEANAILTALAFVVLVLVFAPLSGPHLNPAITAGLWVTRQISGMRAVGYVVAQILGAMLALVVANLFLQEVTDPLTGSSVGLFQARELPKEAAELWRTLGTEAIGMAIFAFGAAAAYLTRRGVFAKAFTLGGALLVGSVALKGSPILNPAVAITLGAVTLNAWALAIYVLVPLLVAMGAVALYRLMQKDAGVEVVESL